MPSGPELVVSTAAFARLHRWAANRAERTEHAAVTRLRLQPAATTAAIVEELAGVPRHEFCLGMAAARAGDRAFEDQCHDCNPGNSSSENIRLQIDRGWTIADGGGLVARVCVQLILIAEARQPSLRFAVASLKQSPPCARDDMAIARDGRRSESAHHCPSQKSPYRTVLRLDRMRAIVAPPCATTGPRQFTRG
jgi:hypothetical protein